MALPPDSGPPPCPSWLEPRAKQTWHRLVKILHDMRIVGTIDQAALGRYCTLFWHWRDVEARLTTLEDLSDPAYLRLAKLASDYADRLLRLEQEFGMTPSARASLGLTLAKTVHEPKPLGKVVDKSRFFSTPTD